MELVEGRATVDDVDAFVEQLAAIGRDHDVVVQAFDARYVVDRAHLQRAVELADRAFERGEAIARDRSVEILLYAAGRRQINRALEMGVGEGTQPVVVVVHDHSDGEGEQGGDGGEETDENNEHAATDAVRELLDQCETLGEYDESLVRDFFDVDEAELAATAGDISDLVRERVALLTIER